MSAGRPPKPARLKTLHGTDRADRARGGAPVPKRGRPTCPPWLDAVAKAKWRKLVPELDRLRLLTIVDGDTLAAYCQAWAEFEAATKLLQTEGRTITRGTGGLAPHPAVAMQRSAWKAIKDFAALFGLDPLSRDRINVPSVKEESKLSRLIHSDDEEDVG